jgi:hypothetical protein
VSPFLLTLVLLQTPTTDVSSDLLWRPKPGSTLAYAVDMEMTVEKDSFLFQTELGLKVVEVQADGAYVVESSTRNSRIKVGANTVATDNTPARRETFTAAGRRVDTSTDADPLSRVLSTVCEFGAPGKVVKSGAAWASQVAPDPKSGRPGSLSEYAFRGSELHDSAQLWRVDYRYKELTGDPAPAAEGVFHLDPADSSVASFSATIQNVKVDPATPPATLKVKMQRLK